MMNWDDGRIFLAIARERSLRKAAEKLGVNRTTVLRRIRTFEDELGVRLFERLPDGYFTTAAGEEMLRAAERMEKEALGAERRIAGGDARLGGKIKITLPAAMATHFLMPHLAAFRRDHPEMSLDILTSNSMADLERREADVAIRMSNNPPADLVGRRAGKVMHCGYVSTGLLARTGSDAVRESVNWIGWSDDPSTMQWIEDSDYPDAVVEAVINDPYVALEAVKAGMGMAMLPCFLGDTEPALVRMPPGNLYLPTDLWILTHADLRNTARIRKFMAFMTEAIGAHSDLLEGRRAWRGANSPETSRNNSVAPRATHR